MSQGLQQLQALLLGQPQRRIGWAARAAAAPAPPAEKQEASASPARTEPGFAGALELEEFQPKRFRLAKPLYFKVGRCNVAVAKAMLSSSPTLFGVLPGPETRLIT